jgi:hypothetical protein
MGVCFLSISTFAFDGVSGMMMNNIDSLLDQHDDMRSETMTDEEKMILVQAHIIQTMFLKPLLEDDPILQMNKEEKEAEMEESMIPMSSQFEFYNKMMSRELATNLAKKDILKMTERHKNRALQVR